MAERVAAAQHHDRLAGEGRSRHRRRGCEGLVPRDNELQRLAEQAEDGEGTPPDRELHEDHVVVALSEAGDEIVRRRLADIEAELGVDRVQARDRVGQDVRPEGGRRAEANRTSEPRLRRVVGVDEIARRFEDGARSADDVAPSGGGDEACARALEELVTEALLEVASCTESEGWLTTQCSAALRKLPRSASATWYSSCFSVGSSLIAATGPGGTCPRRRRRRKRVAGPPARRPPPERRCGREGRAATSPSPGRPPGRRGRRAGGR